MKRPVQVLGAPLVLLVGLAGCASSNKPKPVFAPASQSAKIQVWGEGRGTKPGQFFEPRALAVAPDGFSYVVDSSGRIQKWTREGRFVRAWQAPSIEKGRPEGVAVHPSGEVFVTDTHYSRVLVYSPEGKFKRTFGSYGKGRGQFLLVTGICTDEQGFVYTADYGGDFDRVSKWTHEGKLVASWAGHGEGPRQFRRPCGLAISREGDLLVADIGNHRVQRLDRKTGKCKDPSALGPRGGAPGQMLYPYGVAVDAQGLIYTVEYGAHRVQMWAPGGNYLQAWGGPGRAAGQLANPWGLAVDAYSNVLVADTQNHRVQKFHF
jgi:DNA-binding beta-propeller fold protein YncE